MGDLSIRILRENLPVLFLDTCIPLDIIRSPIRGLSRYAEYAIQILSMTESSPPGCALVAASIIPREWESNVKKVTDDMRNHLRAIEEQSAHFHDACDALGINGGHGRTPYHASGLAERLSELAERFLKAANVMEEDAGCILKAHSRVKHGTPPSRNGAEMKDCTIVEEYLAVCRKLKEMGHSRSRVFCTSNINDYCDGRKRLHAPLAVDFADVGLVFTSNLSWAIHELTRAEEAMHGESMDPVDAN